MGIVTTKRPPVRNWSGNPIHYTIYSSVAEADASVWFEIKIKFKRTDEADFSDIVVLPYKPVQGTAKIDIQDILDGLLEYEIPAVPAANEYLSFLVAKKMTGEFYIAYREITALIPDPPFDESENEDILFVAKGGISFHKWRGDNYWGNYFDQVKPFLTWEKNHSLHSLNERMYLAWLNLTEVDPAAIKMRRKIVYTDMSEDYATLDFAVNENCVGYFPSGAAQLNLISVNTDKNIYYWELQVIESSANPVEPLSETFRYYADNRKDYNAITLNYRNSLGGISSARIRGVIDYTLNRQFTELEKVVLHDYYSSHFIEGRMTAQNSSELQVLKGDLGYLGKEEQDRLRDMNYRRECWWEQQRKWLPVMLLTPSNRLRLSTDKLFSMPIEFCIASGGDYYYTPDSINLAEAAVVAPTVCTAVIENLAAVYAAGTGWTVSWDLASGAPAKYQVSTPAVNGGLPQETTDTEFLFPYLAPGNHVVTVRPVCEIGGLFYLGTAVTLAIEVPAVCVPVAISGAPVYLPNAVETTLYNYVINLTGTAPFVLSNVVKPAWMTIAMVGSTVEVTGTPGGTDAGTDIAVSFDLGNCAGSGAVSFADTIDVLDAVDNGELLLINECSGMSTIKNLFPNNPAFYSFTGGNMPVIAGQTTTGILTQNINTPISVFVIHGGEFFDPALFLYKNGIEIEMILIHGSGIFSFNSISFDITDNMTIKLSPSI